MHAFTDTNLILIFAIIGDIMISMAGEPSCYIETVIMELRFELIYFANLLDTTF